MNDLFEFPEVSALREMRSDAPLSTAEHLAPQRELLMTALQGEADGAGNAAVGTPLALPRRRLVLVAAAVVAGVGVTGGAVASLAGESSRTAAPATGLLSAQASADTLELAAVTVEKLGENEPGPKQWVYEKNTTFGHGGPQTSEQWTRWDGTGSARLPGFPRDGVFDPDKLQVWYYPNQEEKWKREGYDDRSQRQFYRFLATLPSDPGRMMKRIREEAGIGDLQGEARAERDWREIDVLYRSVLIPPNVRAGLFRALARIPGARVEKGVKDPIGRPAIGVTVTYTKLTASGYLGKQELFFDTETYAYLGEALDTGLDGSQDAAYITARAAWGVVDKPGARP
ncbi:CU044_5270 family protein [Streptomyces sp. WI04-05B]|uniref:CU044_5270 family protein n=2 Tax=Streptomyces TaxID=1883 RepID=UPI0029A4EEB0|nr:MULTISPECIES: CU044_5270 family protein [unclassified Streptomyces]MDX2545240.1 CU044_5270 family protein [Streptomyces sp. WI04-05B]MDX2587354.1 CU044_5270 family protein [Streptomyces sp. WI04-05A]